MNLFADLMAFARVVETGSFTAAAAELGLAKSSVSKQIAALEKAHGVRLVNRTTRQVSITEEGLQLYAHCQRLQEELHAASEQLAQFSDAARGKLRVSAPPLLAGTWLAPFLADFLREHPAIELELQLTEQRSDPVRDRFDVLIRMGELADSSLIGHRLATFKPVLVASRGYIDAHGAPRHPEELAQHNCLMWSPPRQRPLRDWRFSRAGEELLVSVRGNLVTNDAHAVKQAVLGGAGIALLPSYMLEEGLLPLLQDYAQPSLPVYLMYGHRTQMPARQRVFIEALKRFAASRET